MVRYLASWRGRIVLSGCLVSLLLAALPDIDIRISSMFFDAGFPVQDLWWNRLLHAGLPYLLSLTLIGLLAVYAFNRRTKRNVWGIDGKTTGYLFLVVALGAGLVVNVVLKDQFGRARPRDIQEFGGSMRFTPAFVISDQCERNCSFSNGDGAAAFSALALARVFSRRRSVALAAAAFGTTVSLVRVAAGAHFFSDSVVSFVVMTAVSDTLYLSMMVPAARRWRFFRRSGGPANRRIRRRV